MKQLMTAFALLASLSTYAQLPRRVFLGIKMEELTADARRIMGADIDNGVLISEVFARSTAEQAGWKKGDILVTVDGEPVKSTGGLIAYLGRKTTGTKISYEVYRNKRHLTGTAVLQPMPEEHYPGIEMEYSAATTSVGEQRMIISKPAGNTRRKPAVLFIGGIGCYSLDFPFDSTRTEVRLLNDLTRAGLVCARAEKPGMGDNGKTRGCAEVGFMEEMEGYADMVNTLKRRPDVDSNAIYVFGHSMGGVFAPLIAQRTHLKGIIAYGTIGSNFLEYLMKTRKTIAEAYRMPPGEADTFVKLSCECAVYYFAERMTPEQADAKRRGCRDHVSVFELRSRTYNNELYELNIPALWSRYTGKALLLWGTADFISSEDDHRIIEQAVNRQHPGNATFARIANSDHGMQAATDFSAAANNDHGVYNKETSNAVLRWMQHI